MMQRLSLLVLVGLYGCAAEEGSTLEILWVMAPNQGSCIFSAGGNTFQSEGFYDPSGGGSYVMPIELRNNVDDEGDQLLQNFGEVNTRPAFATIQLRGFEACWFREDTSNLDLTGDEQRDCSNQPAGRRAFVTASASVGPEGGRTVVTPFMLSITDLQDADIYGPGFDPENIPTVGSRDGDGDGTVDFISFAADLDNAADPAARDAAWGNFPVARSNRILMQARGYGQLQDGREVVSNWIQFPIDVCPHCARASCGVIAEDVCDDGATFALQGLILSSEESCLPFSGIGVECEDFSRCP